MARGCAFPPLSMGAVMRLNPYALDAAAEIVFQCRCDQSSRPAKRDAARIVQAYLQAIRAYPPAASQLARALTASSQPGPPEQER